MIKYLKQLFSWETAKSPEGKAPVDEQKKLKIATCVLLIEMAKADSEFTEDEQKEIIKSMESIFNIEKKYIDELIEFSTGEVKNSISLYEFTNTINGSFSADEKFELLKNLWRLIYSDELLDMHEDHLIKKIGVMLNLEHRDVIAAKLMVKEELRGRRR